MGAMLNIGPFAQITGLSVKALRHYADKNVLIPAEVDPASGYRRYGEHQIADGILLQALRRADVPLSEIAETIASGGGAERATDVLAAQRDRTLAERSREDQAFAEAAMILDSLSIPAHVSERREQAQSFVGQRLSFDDADADDAIAETLVADLFQRVRDAGLGPTGQFWISMRQVPGKSDEMEMLLCWPTFAPTAQHWGGPDIVSGELPPRHELVASWTSEQQPPEGVANPAFAALFEAMAERELEPSDGEIRQRTRWHEGGSQTLEVSVTIA